MQYTTYKIIGDTDLDSSEAAGYGYYFIDVTANTVIEMSSFMSTGMVYIFNRLDTSTATVTLNTKENQEINGGSSISIPNGSYIEVISDGNEWIASTFTKD